MIGNNIIDALKRELSIENVLSALAKKEGKVKGRGGSQPYTSHLDRLNWEFLVVDGPINAVCYPGGMIIVFTGLLKHCRSDAELATVIGHEVFV
jgi:metalloendopeptidase OMA1, mitochondrial